MLLLYILAVAAILIAEHYFRDPLFQWTLDNIPSLQNAQSRQTIYFFEFMTNFGEGPFQAVIFGIIFCFVSREKAFYILIILAF